MKQIIKTPKGDYIHQQKVLYLGIKQINKEQANINLQLLKFILDKNDVPFGLIYGTLLGSVREHDFITHDEDIDLYILDEYKTNFYSALFELRDQGFEVVRNDRAGLISIMRNNEYIDFYIFKKYKPGIRICSGLCILEKYLKNTITIKFNGSNYNIPQAYEEWLTFEYGKNWRTPIKYTDFKISKLKKIFFYTKEKIKDLLPDNLYFLIKKRYEQKTIHEFYRKLNKLQINNEDFSHYSNL